MDIPGEITALRAEQDRLRNDLQRLDERIRTLEQPPEPEPAPVPENILPAAPPEPPAEIPIVAEPIPAPSSLPAPAPFVAPDLPPPLPATAPTAPKPRESLELRVGQVWLARAGIVILLTGLVFLGNYAYHEYIGRLGASGKLTLLYLAGAGLGGLGAWLSRCHASLKSYGRVLLAGGCATLYYATYAAHFVPRLRVIESPLVGGALLLALGGLFVFLADRRRSQLLAGATIALTYYTAAINALAPFSLFSNLVISAAAVTLLARRRWASVTFLSLVGSYGSFAFWRVQNTGSLFVFTAPDAAAFWTAVLFPAAYWIVHTVAVLLRRTNGLAPEARPIFLTLNNAAFFALAAPAVAGTHPDVFWLMPTAFGGILLALAAVAARLAPDERRFDRAYLAQGLALVSLGLFIHFTGWQRALSFALLSSTLISLGRLRHGGVYRFFAGVSAFAATFVALENLGRGHEHARLVTAGVAAILIANAWILKRSSGFAPRIDWRALGFVGLSASLATAACLEGTLFSSALRLLALSAGALTLLRWHRLPEAAQVAQPVALLAQALLAVCLFTEPNPNLVVIASAASALAFIHLWQWQSHAGLPGRRWWQPLHVLPAIGITLAWSFSQWGPADRAPILALIALLVLAHGFLTRVRVIAVASLPFTFFAISSAAFAVAETPPAAGPLIATALIAAQSLVLAGLGQRAALTESPRRSMQCAIHVIALALGVGLIFADLPASSWFLALTGGGFALFVLASRTGSGEPLFYAAAFCVIAAATWILRLPDAAPYWPDIFGFLAFAVAQRIGRRRLSATQWFDRSVQASLCLFAGLGSWVLLHRLVGEVAGGFLVTVAWSLLALPVLVGGFLLKERSYRLLGLFILAAAVVRIFAVDVWQLDTLFRILSFLVLGGVLLGLAFLYNRYAETLRKWL